MAQPSLFLLQPAAVTATYTGQVSSNPTLCQARKQRPVIHVLWRQRQEELQFRASLDCRLFSQNRKWRSCLKFPSEGAGDVVKTEPRPGFPVID